MSVLNKPVSPLPLNDERRRFQRVRVDLLGRYMLADRREFPCQVIDMSPGGMAMLAPAAGRPGERVIAYIDHVGRLEGVIVRALPNGFAMTIAAPERKRDKLAAQLTWLANRHILGLPEDRRHGRLVPQNPRTTATLPDGRRIPCRLLDVSLSGAAVGSELKPPVGSIVMLGRAQARVVRIRADGFAVEFTRLQHPDFLEENLTAFRGRLHRQRRRAASARSLLDSSSRPQGVGDPGRSLRWASPGVSIRARYFAPNRNSKRSFG